MSVDPTAQINQLLSEGKYQEALQIAQQYGLTQVAQQIQALINVNRLLNSSGEALMKDDYNTALNDLQQALQIAQQYPNLTDVVPDIQQQIQTVRAMQQIQQYANNAVSDLEKGDFAGAYQYLQQAQQLARQYDLSSKGLDDVTTAVSYLAKIPSPPQPPKGELTLQELQQYLQALNSFFVTASQYATEASRYYSGFSSLANGYRQSQQVSSQLLSVVNLLINAQNTVEQNGDSVPAVQDAINLVQQAQKQLQTVNANGTPLADLASSLSEVVQEMYIKYTALLQVLENLKKKSTRSRKWKLF
jgi:tetratricopeptide (TPR) repeat protein